MAYTLASWPGRGTGTQLSRSVAAYLPESKQTCNQGFTKLPQTKSESDYRTFKSDSLNKNLIFYIALQHFIYGAAQSVDTPLISDFMENYLKRSVAHGKMLMRESTFHSNSKFIV